MPTGWRLHLPPTVALVGLLGCFFGWFYGIYWKIAAYLADGGFPCWPEFMCG